MMDFRNVLKEDLEKRIFKITTEMDQIRSKLAEAKSEAATTGIYADKEWFNRATYALKAKGREHQQLQIELGKRNKAQRQLRAGKLEAIFVDIARRKLDSTVFHNLMQEATATEIMLNEEITNDNHS